MTEISGLTIAGLITATFLFLTASGLTLVFGVSRVLNLAHGSFVMFGAYLAYQVTSWIGVDSVQFWIALIAVPPMVGLGAMLFEGTILRRTYKADLMAQTLVTVALLFALADLVRLIWGPRQRSVSIPEQMTGTVSILGSHFPIYDFAVIFFGVLVAVGLIVLINRTRWGLIIRACAQDREMATALGVNEKLVFTMVFGLGGALAGMAGVLAVPMVTANGSLADEYLILALVVVVMGGLGSVTGSMIAALCIGLVRSYGTLLVPQFELASVFAAMALVLIVRPQGLLGRPE